MTKQEFVSAIAEKANLSKKDAGAGWDAAVEVIIETLKKGEKIQLVGFGNFEVRERAARDGMNLHTKEKIKIPASKVPAFKPGKPFKEAISK